MTSEHLPVDVESKADDSNREIAPAQDGRVVKRCPVERAVQETRRDEESGGAVQSPSALVAAEDATNLAHTRRVAQRADDPPQAGWHDGPPTWQDRP